MKSTDFGGPTIVSGIVTWDAPISYWLIFFSVSSNSTRSLCDLRKLARPSFLSFLKWPLKGSNGGTVVRVPPSTNVHGPGSRESQRRRHMWVEFVVGSLPCSERFFSGYSGFPLSPKDRVVKFQLDQKW